METDHSLEEWPKGKAALEHVITEMEDANSLGNENASKCEDDTNGVIEDSIGTPAANALAGTSRPAETLTETPYENNFDNSLDKPHHSEVEKHNSNGTLTVSALTDANGPAEILPENYVETTVDDSDNTKDDTHTLTCAKDPTDTCIEIPIENDVTATVNEPDTIEETPNSNETHRVDAGSYAENPKEFGKDIPNKTGFDEPKGGLCDSEHETCDGQDDSTTVNKVDVGINISDENINHENDDNTVTLRRKKTEFSNYAEAVGDDDYRYIECITPKSGTSRRMVEIGRETLISDDDLRLAATLVHDAMEGRTVDIKTEPKYVKSYNHFKSWPLTYLLYVTLIVDLSLVLFEKPSIEGVEHNFIATTCAEFVCLAYFTARTCHHYHWRSKTKFFKDYKNLIIIGIIALTMIDIIVFLILQHVSPDKDHVRYSRVLRALLIVNFSDGRQIRRAWRNMRRTILEIAHVLLLFIFFILVFGLIAHLLFKDRTDIEFPDGRPYFKDYMDGVWELYVLVTTSNNPDVMIPALDKSKYYCVFFFVYILVCFYMLLNVFLAVAYHSYNSNLKMEIKRSCSEKKRKLGMAFDVLKVNHNGEDMVTYKTWKGLMRLAQPNLSKNQVDLLMLILDMDRSGHIGRREFMNVSDLLNVPVSEVDDRITLIEKLFPRLYNSVPSEYLKTFVDHVMFTIVFDLIVVTEVLLIGFNVQNINNIFCGIFIVEILLKIYTRGGRKYFKKISNWFDNLVTAATIIILIVQNSNVADAQITNGFVSAVKIVRTFRILRLFVHIKRFKIIADTLINISMSILMYCGILFIIFYVFAIIGMEFFYGKIVNYGYDKNSTLEEMYCGASVLQNSSFYESRYCALNFNNFINSVLILATVLFENNWHILTEGFVAVSGVGAQIYFAIFFMSVSVVVMNIITAFVVDMFMYEYTIQKEGKADSIVENKIKELGLGIDAETGLEISKPLSDCEMEELMKESGMSQPRAHPWIEKATLRGLRHADINLTQFSSLVNKRKSSMPTLNRFDGIRFHIKKRGWTKIEVLLQQLYENDNDDEIKNSNTDIRRQHGHRNLMV